jgi:hypothetical protein
MSNEPEVRALVGVVCVVAGTGIAGSLFPSAATTITVTVGALCVVGLVVRVGCWRMREWRLDRADALAAAAARAAFDGRQRSTAEPAHGREAA